MCPLYSCTALAAAVWFLRACRDGKELILVRNDMKKASRDQSSMITLFLVLDPIHLHPPQSLTHASWLMCVFGCWWYCWMYSNGNYGRRQVRFVIDGIESDLLTLMFFPRMRTQTMRPLERTVCCANPVVCCTVRWTSMVDMGGGELHLLLIESGLTSWCWYVKSKPKATGAHGMLWRQD